MLSMLFYFMFLVAGATTVNHTVDFPVNKTAPVASIPASQPINWSVMYGLNPDLPNANIVSSWAPLSCAIIDGIIHARFTSTRATWPSSWPSTATCTASFNGTDTIVVTLNILTCPTTTAACARKDVDKSQSIQSCPASWTFAAPPGFQSNICRLAAPPTGKVYASPKWAVAEGNRMMYPAQYKVGASANPDTDPQIPGVICAIWGFDPDAAGPNLYSLHAEVHDSIVKDTTLYCAIRHQTTATKAFSWGTETVIVVDRP
jgi:hypothetical protein